MSAGNVRWLSPRSLNTERWLKIGFREAAWDMLGLYPTAVCRRAKRTVAGLAQPRFVLARPFGWQCATPMRIQGRLSEEKEACIANHGPCKPRACKRQICYLVTPNSDALSVRGRFKDSRPPWTMDGFAATCSGLTRFSCYARGEGNVSSRRLSGSQKPASAVFGHGASHSAMN